MAFFKSSGETSPSRVHRQARDLEPFLFFQIIEAMQHRVMLDGGGDEVPALGFEQPRRAENREIVALRAAAGENHLAGLAARELWPRGRAHRPATPGPAGRRDARSTDCPKSRPETAASPRAPPDPAASWRCNRSKSCAASRPFCGEVRQNDELKIKGAESLRLQNTIYDLRFTQLWVNLSVIANQIT